MESSIQAYLCVGLEVKGGNCLGHTLRKFSKLNRNRSRAMPQAFHFLCWELADRRDFKL